MAFQNVLPDPNNTIGDTGKATAGGAGPGYKSVSVTSNQAVMNERTNSGRLITRLASGHSWELSISYNPLTRAEFEPLNSFLLHKKGGLIPFFVSLPQNKAPQSATFAKTVRPTTEAVGGVNGLGKEPLAAHVPQAGGTFIVGQQYKITTTTSNNWSSVGGSTSAANGQVFVATAVGTSGLGAAEPTYTKAGADNILMSFADYDEGTQGAPKPGDFFTIDDDSDSNHTKMYQVVRTETRTAYENQPPEDGTDTDTARLYIVPALQRNLYDGAKLVFHNPLMRVTLPGTTQKYSLDSKNLYQISLKLQEAQK